LPRFGSDYAQYSEAKFLQVRQIISTEWGAVRSRSFRFVVIDEAFGRGSDESAQYGLRLFAQLNLQLLIVTPLQKIHIIEPFVASVGFVHNEEGRSSKRRWPAPFRACGPCFALWLGLRYRIITASAGEASHVR
jgi:uncharacterized protein YPO0396